MSIAEFIVAVIATLFTIAAFFVGTAQLLISVLPAFQESRNRKILNDKFSRGPYDKGTIERSTKNYIRPKCSNIDPGQEEELRHALIATREDLFEKVDQFLSSDIKRKHLLILADSGTGKTSFLLNYYAYNSRRLRGKRHKISIVPLGIKDADELISSIPNRSETVIFLDALDEDVKAIQNHKDRIISLMNNCRDFKKVVITCRTQFFPKDEEIPVETGIVKIGPREAGEKGVYEFWKLYLSPFDDVDIKKYIKKRYPFWALRARERAEEIALRIPLLSVRPMLLANIPEVISRKADVKFTYQLYEIMLDAWLEREANWVDKSSLRAFSERLAVDLYINRQRRGMERISQNELSLMALQWNIELKEWQITGRSLLNRDAEGNYKFAHRSFMEYLFIYRLLTGDKSCYGVEITDQMKAFLSEIFVAFKLSDVSAINNLLKEYPVLVLSFIRENNPPHLMEIIDTNKENPLKFLTVKGNYTFIRDTNTNSLLRGNKDIVEKLNIRINDSGNTYKYTMDFWKIAKINLGGDIIFISIPSENESLGIQLKFLDELTENKRHQRLASILKLNTVK